MNQQCRVCRFGTLLTASGLSASVHAGRKGSRLLTVMLGFATRYLDGHVAGNIEVGGGNRPITGDWRVRLLALMNPELAHV
jgi:hypothetical protein